MSIESEITRLVEAKQDLKGWLTGKGVSVPSNALLPAMVDLLGNVQTAADLQDLDEVAF